MFKKLGCNKTKFGMKIYKQILMQIPVYVVLLCSEIVCPSQLLGLLRKMFTKNFTTADPLIYFLITDPEPRQQVATSDRFPKSSLKSFKACLVLIIHRPLQITATVSLFVFIHISDVTHMYNCEKSMFLNFQSIFHFRNFTIKRALSTP